MDLPAPINKLHRPEYTGSRRCWPCTAVNLVLVVLIAGLVWVILSRLVGVGSALGATVVTVSVGAVLILFRGYAVPYTPRFAPRVVDRLGLGWLFRKHDPVRGTLRETDADEAPDGEALLSVLVDANIIRVSGDEVRIDEEVYQEWREEMSSLASLTTEQLTRATEEVSDAATARPEIGDDREWVVLSDGRQGLAGETWLPRPVAVAETGAMRVLAERLPDPTIRRAAVGSLRMFLESCPDCGSSLEETDTAACCGGHTDPRSVPDDVLACPECEVRLYVFDES